MSKRHLRAYRGPLRGLAVVSILLMLAACGSTPRPATDGVRPHFKIGRPYQIDGRRYVPAFVTTYRAEGVASWYGEPYHGRLTANGEVFDMHALTAAHPTLPLPSVVRVTDLDNGRSLVLRVNDRGPFVDGRLIDLSFAAARELGFVDEGLARVRVTLLGIAALDDPPIRPGEERDYATLQCTLPKPEVLVC